MKSVRVKAANISKLHNFDFPEKATRKVIQDWKCPTNTAVGIITI